MNVHIDRFLALVLVMTTGFFLGYAATGRISLGFGIMAVSGILFKALCDLWRSGPGMRRAKRKRRTFAAQRLVESWAVHPDEADLRSRLERRYGPGDYALVLYPLHPQGPALNATQVLETYRSHAGTSQLLICATGPVSLQARAAARELNHPVVRILDSAALKTIALYGPLPEESAASPGRKGFRLSIPRKRAPALFMYALVMAVLYVCAGSYICLALLAILLFLGIVCIRKPRSRDRLWE